MKRAATNSISDLAIVLFCPRKRPRSEHGCVTVQSPIELANAIEHCLSDFE
jgi:hypothetical protein